MQAVLEEEENLGQIQEREAAIKNLEVMLVRILEFMCLFVIKYVSINI